MKINLNDNKSVKAVGGREADI